MKKILFFVILAEMLFITFDSCKPSATTPPDAKFYLINVSPNSTSLDFFLDGASVNSNLQYGQDSGYFSTSPGLHDLIFRKAGISQDLINVNMSLTAGQSYSIFVIDSVNNIRPAAVSDTTSFPAGDTAKIRLLDFCINSPSLITEFAADTLIKLRYSLRTFNDQNANANNALFSKIVAGTYTLNLKKLPDSSLITSFPNIQLTSGKIYTVYLKGSYDSTNASSIGEGIIQHN